MPHPTAIGRTAPRFAALAIAVLAVLATGCSARHDGRGPATAVHVTERDFRITVRPARVHAGEVRLSVLNRGPVNHELIVVEAQSRLPERSDGMTIDEDALKPVTIRTLEPGNPGETRVLDLHLAPGRYELFCNMSGHFLGGMHAELVVT
jgi:uncharacterized cupredoxin-like copper-binding protein